MNVRIKFLGGAGTVTGSKYILEIDDFKLMIDCGLFQGVKELRLKNWEPFPVNAEEINAIVLTHAHIDHTGYLPRLVKEGFSGPIYCNDATEDLVKILLLDSAKLQEEEAAFAKKKGYSKHENPQPLYGIKDAENVFPLIRSIDYYQEITIKDNVLVKFKNAGHILGASIVEVKVLGENQHKKIVFSGDLGRYNDPMLYPPTPVEHTDVLLVESTYGNRENPMGDLSLQLAEIVNRAMDRGGCMLIPAFSVGRTQLMLYYLKKLIQNGSIPDVPVYLDSPMAISATNLHKRHFEYHKLDEFDLDNNHAVFDFKNFHYKSSQDDSMQINNLKNNAIIISASGMCTGGRIMHHLYNRLKNENDTVLFVGYQAEGTRGRRILDGEPTVKIFGYDIEVKCHIERIEGLSAHADKAELLTWLDQFNDSPKITFIIHGEENSSREFADTIVENYGWNVTVPSFNESHELFRGI